jgi:hypothetical protein
MRRFGGYFLFVAALATTAGCSPYNVDVSLEGINWFVVHPRLYCFEYPYSNPRCPYYDYPDCDWGSVVQQPSVSAANSAAVVTKLEDKTY